jgi:hypothetical protein
MFLLFDLWIKISQDMSEVSRLFRTQSYNRHFIQNQKKSKNYSHTQTVVTCLKQNLIQTLLNRRIILEGHSAISIRFSLYES